MIAKEPVPGRVKTRLTPAFTPLQAAALAEASLADTLAAVAEDHGGPPRARPGNGYSAPGCPLGFDVIGQRAARAWTSASPGPCPTRG